MTDRQAQIADNVDNKMEVLTEKVDSIISIRDNEMPECKATVERNV